MYGHQYGSVWHTKTQSQISQCDDMFTTMISMSWWYQCDDMWWRALVRTKTQRTPHSGKSSDYVITELQQFASQISQNARPEIVDAELTYLIRLLMAHRPVKIIGNLVFARRPLQHKYDSYLDATQLAQRVEVSLWPHCRIPNLTARFKTYQISAAIHIAELSIHTWAGHTPLGSLLLSFRKSRHCDNGQNRLTENATVCGVTNDWC